MKRFCSIILAVLGMFVLIIDSKTALSGAQEGIIMCASAVIPAIFPFLVLSNYLVGALSGRAIPILRPLRRLLRISDGAESIFLTGLLGGYPTGAQAVHTAWSAGWLSTCNANRMLAFCSNAGPAFIFGILSNQFPQYWMLWLLWGIHIISAIIVSFFIPTKQQSACVRADATPVTFVQSLRKSVITMACICGWIVLFRVLMAFLDRWVLWALPSEWGVGLLGLLELTNGCCSLKAISSVGLRFIICSVMLAFGGLCVAMQTASVIGRLNMRYYLFGKTMQAMISLLLSTSVQFLLFADEYRIPLPFLPALAAIIALGIILFLFAKKEKNSSISAAVGV